MTGRREQQKALRRKSILTAALHMFTERSYDTVKLEEIAKEAGVSAGTIYIYFKTKNDLLLAIIVEDFEIVFEKVETLTIRPTDTAPEVLNRLTELFVLQDAVQIPSSLWRAAVSAYIKNPFSHFAHEYTKYLERMRACYHTVITALVEQNLLPKDTQIPLLTDLLYNQYNMCFLEFIQSDTAAIEDYKQRLFKMTDYIVGGQP